MSRRAPVSALRNLSAVSPHTASISRERPTGAQVFVDESKAGDYLLVAAIIVPSQLAAARKAVRGLILPGQRRIHMNGESDRRRRLILSAVTEVAPAVTIYRAHAASRTELERRDRCIDALVNDAATDRHLELILELDVRVERRDRQRIIVASRAAGCSGRLAHRHATAAAEPLLAIPDAVGWAWARGGDWRRRCDSLNIRVTDV